MLNRKRGRTQNTNESSTFNKKEEFEEDGDLYQNEDIQIMTDDEEEAQNKDKDNLRVTQGKEILVNTMINPYKINKGLELLEKIQEKRKNSKLDLNMKNQKKQINGYYLNIIIQLKM